MSNSRAPTDNTKKNVIDKKLTAALNLLLYCHKFHVFVWCFKELYSMWESTDYVCDQVYTRTRFFLALSTMMWAFFSFLCLRCTFFVPNKNKSQSLIVHQTFYIFVQTKQRYLFRNVPTSSFSLSTFSSSPNFVVVVWSGQKSVCFTNRFSYFVQYTEFASTFAAFAVSSMIRSFSFRWFFFGVGSFARSLFLVVCSAEKPLLLFIPYIPVCKYTRHTQFLWTHRFNTFFFNTSSYKRDSHPHFIPKQLETFVENV